MYIYIKQESIKLKYSKQKNTSKAGQAKDLSAPLFESRNKQYFRQKNKRMKKPEILELTFG
jgi:hypothetical protein